MEDLRRALARAGRDMSPASTLAIGAVRLYQWTLRPVIGGNCRFEPSCSDYPAEALRAHGARAGRRSGRLGESFAAILGMRAGCDPVPPCDATDGRPRRPAIPWML